MKNYLLQLLLFSYSLFFCFSARGQISTTATYSSGILSTDGSSLVNISNNSSCPGILTVNVPSGRFVTSVDVTYDMESLGINWISDQWSYLECVTTSTKETQVTSGVLNVTGIQTYSRTGLTIANGLVGAGGVQFELNAFRYFGSNCTSTGHRVLNNSWMVTVHHTVPPSCLPPTNLQVTTATANGVDLAWNAGGALNWQIEYGPIGFVPGTGTLVSSTTNPYTLSGLNSSSKYEVYVKDSCSPTDVSAWAGPLTFATLCTPVSAPYTQNFDGTEFIPSILFNDTGSVDLCFDRSVGNYFWTPGPPPFLTVGTGPSGDHTTGNGQYMYIDFGSSATPPPHVAVFETPSIDLSGLTVPELVFWYHMYGNGIGTIDVEIDKGNGYVNLITYNGEQQVSNTSLWKQANINLAAYANDTIRIKFVGTMPSSSIRSQVAIDDIEIIEAPACPKPQNLQSANVASNSMDLSWTSGGATNWQIEYGPSGFTSGTGTLINVTTNPTTINGLAPNSTYDFYLRDSCGVSDLSGWFGPFSENTNCTLFTAPFMENFDASVWVASNGSSAGSISPCWSRNNTTGFFWTTGQNGTPSFNTGPISDHTSGSGKFAYTEGFASGNPNITSADIDVSGLTSPELRFWYHMYGTRISELRVLIHDGNSWNQEATILGQSHTSNTSLWSEKIIDLSAYVGDTIKIRFRGLRNGIGSTSDIAIDDVWVGNSPTCTGPTNLVASATTLNSVVLDWTTGGASNWQVRYRASGTTGPFSIVPVNAKPHVLSGLSPATTYEIYVRDSCAVGDVSFWHGPTYATTDCNVAIAPWTESFDAGNWLSGSGFGNVGNQIGLCWNRNTTTTVQWGTISGPTQTPNTGPTGAYSGSNYIYREGSGAFSGAGTITSPSIFIPSTINSPYLYFYYHMFGNNVTSIKISVNDGSGYTNVYTKNGQQQLSSGAAWIKDSVDMSSYLGDTITFRLIGTNSGFSGDIAVDQMSIESSAPLCSNPTALVISNIATHSADLTWISTNIGLSSVEYYDITVGPPRIILGNLTSPYSLNNLNPNTSYVINVYDSCSASVQSSMISDTIVTVACPAVTAGFNFSTNVLDASFTSSSVNADSLLWDFDGLSMSNLSNPSHSFAMAGTYNITLIAYNFCGTCDTILIPIQVCDSLISNFTFTNNNDTISFDAANSIGSTSYEWDFGNGNIGSGVQINEYFANSGKYVVTLKVKNSCGDSTTFSDTVEICLSPVANWNYTIISSGGSGMEVQFDGSGSQNAVQYSWDFGDGNTNNNSSQPIHTYIVPSVLYNVVLTVTNSCGETHASSYRLNEIGLDEFYITDRVDIYPNPMSEISYVEWDPNKLNPILLEIYDMTGKFLRRQPLVKDNTLFGKVEIDASEIANGVYLIRLVGDNLDVRKEFIVQH